MADQLQGHPMGLITGASDRLRDREAMDYNIASARAVGEALRTTLGPRGMDKMIVDEHGDVTITNDGVTILRELEIDNPPANMIVSVAITLDTELGDGTTSGVVLAGELLGAAEGLLERGLHPTTIIRGFALGSQRARDELADISFPCDREDDERLRAVAKTAMTGSGPDATKDHLAGLVVDAVRRVTVEGDDGWVIDVAFADTETQVGPPVDESMLVDGGAIETDPVHEAMPRTVEDARILLLDAPLAVEDSDLGAQIDLESYDQLHRFLDSEETALREKVELIDDAGATVVISGSEIDELAGHVLSKTGVLAIEDPEDEELAFLATALNTRIVVDLRSLDADDLPGGRVTRDAHDEVFFVEGSAERSHGVTVLVRGSTEHVVEDVERSVSDAIAAVGQVAADEWVLPGGGAVEVELASRLHDYAEGLEGREQLAVEAFADALEFVPRVLASNAGVDTIDALVDLRAAHAEGQTAAGIDGTDGAIVDAVDAGIVESVETKRHVIGTAAEAANAVLKIDDIISATDLGSGGAGGGGEGGGAGGDA